MVFCTFRSVSRRSWHDNQRDHLRNDWLVSMSPTNKWLNGVTITIAKETLPIVSLVVHVVSVQVQQRN